jgi:hypothetical protein
MRFPWPAARIAIDSGGDVDAPGVDAPGVEPTDAALRRAVRALLEVLRALIAYVIRRQRCLRLRKL